MRKAVMGATRSGQTLVFNFGKLTKDFVVEWNDKDNFPTDLIFDKAAWKKEENHMKIVKDEENQDLSGNDGQYIMGEKFTICCLFDHLGDDKMAA